MYIIETRLRKVKQEIIFKDLHSQKKVSGYESKLKKIDNRQNSKCQALIWKTIQTHEDIQRLINNYTSSTNVDSYDAHIFKTYPTLNIMFY